MENHTPSERVIFFSIIGVALILSAIYMYVAWKKRKTPQLVNVCLMFGGSLGVVSGLKLDFLVCVDEIKMQGGNDDKIAIIMGGLAICWVSVLTIRDGFRHRE